MRKQSIILILTAICFTTSCTVQKFNRTYQKIGNAYIVEQSANNDCRGSTFMRKDSTVLQGNFSLNYPNKQVTYGAFNNGYLTDTVYTLEKGDIVEKGVYQQGLLNGSFEEVITEFDPKIDRDREFKLTSSFKSGKAEGLRYLFVDDTLISITNYSNGVKTETEVWLEEGDTSSVFKYTVDVLIVQFPQWYINSEKNQDFLDFEVKGKISITGDPSVSQYPHILDLILDLIYVSERECNLKRAYIIDYDDDKWVGFFTSGKFLTIRQ